MKTLIKELVAKFKDADIEELQEQIQELAINLESTVKDFKVSTVAPSDVSIAVIENAINGVFNSELGQLVHNDELEPKQAWAIIYSLMLTVFQDLTLKGSSDIAGLVQVAIYNSTTKTN